MSNSETMNVRGVTDRQEKCKRIHKVITVLCFVVSSPVPVVNSYSLLCRLNLNILCTSRKMSSPLSDFLNLFHHFSLYKTDIR